MRKPYSLWFLLKARLKWHFYLRWTREFRSLKATHEAIVKEAVRLHKEIEKEKHR